MATSLLSYDARSRAKRLFDFRCYRKGHRPLYICFTEEDTPGAAAFFTHLTESHDFKWKDNTTVSCGDMKIYCNRLEDAAEGDPRDLDEQTLVRIARWLGEPVAGVKPEDEVALMVTEDAVTLPELCKEFGIKPAVARRIFRREGVEKPGNRWEWVGPGLEEARKVLEKNCR